jgi:hypothetical protein
MCQQTPSIAVPIHLNVGSADHTFDRRKLFRSIQHPGILRRRTDVQDPPKRRAAMTAMPTCACRCEEISDHEHSGIIENVVEFLLNEVARRQAAG